MPPRMSDSVVPRVLTALGLPVRPTPYGYDLGLYEGEPFRLERGSGIAGRGHEWNITNVRSGERGPRAKETGELRRRLLEWMAGPRPPGASFARMHSNRFGESVIWITLKEKAVGGKCSTCAGPLTGQNQKKFCSTACSNQRRLAHWQERFWERVKKGDGCWLWDTARDKDGYGRFPIGASGENKAHRVSWRIHHGEVPEGLCVLHKCDNPPCVNPKHLFLGTLKDNAVDCASKERTARGKRNGAYTHPEKILRGNAHWTRKNPHLVPRGDRNGARVHPERLARGVVHPNAKLNDKKVREIRRRFDAGETVAELARAYGVCNPTILRVALRKGWTHVKEAS